MKNRHPGGKFKTTFESGLWTVTRVKGTLVTVTTGNDIVTRNISCFKIYHGDHTDCQGSENDRSQEREDEDFRRPSSSTESRPKNSPISARDESGDREVAPTRVPTQVEENQPSEVPVEENGPEVIQRRGMGRYHLRSRISPPERLKDYVCE
ncbi:hypothetical protein NDU88_005190 [Pleurodeles waltl]|uniref:Uncharacterized protein n=1 Tax=Pleurodeles waltl TaxID=8319 RepID=A0AAV7SL33_PLEWA|nr:hypothetical protein NDU88_005190 [Pleurodeles waltl]